MPQAGLPKLPGQTLGHCRPVWLPTLQAGGTLQFEQCVPSRSLELGPVYFLMMARKPFQNQQANFSFRLQEVSRESKHIFHNGSLAMALAAEPRRRVVLTSQQGPREVGGCPQATVAWRTGLRSCGEPSPLLTEQDIADRNLCLYRPGVPPSTVLLPLRTLANTDLFGLPTIPSAHGPSSAAHLPLELGAWEFSLPFMFGGPQT